MSGMPTITPTEMSALTAMAASLQQQRAVLPLLQGLAAPAPAPAPAPHSGARVDARA